MNYNVMGELEYLDNLLRDPDQASLIPGEKKKLHLLIAQVQAYLEALQEDETPETLKACEKILSKLEAQNDEMY